MTSLNLETFWNVCEECGERYTTLHLPEGTYGPLLLWATDEEMRLLDPEEDEAWEEVERLADRFLENRPLDTRVKVEAFYRALEVATDLSSGGKPFTVWGRRPCTACGSYRCADFGPISPPQLVHVELSAPTHRHWASLSPEEKERTVRQAIVLHLDEPTQR